MVSQTRLKETKIGTDLHGPFIEQYSGDNWKFVAQLSWGRDYLLFDIMDGGRHGRQAYTVSLPREAPITGLCWEYNVFHRPDEIIGILKAKVCQEFKLDFDISKEDFISNYWNMLEKEEMWDHPMNGLYLDMVAMYQDKCVPHSLTPEECIKVQEVYIESMERYKEANPDYTHDPDRHEGLDLAISIMQGLKQPTRLVYCYTY